MRSPSYTGQFTRDVKPVEKRGELLLTGLSLPRELGGHPLKGALFRKIAPAPRRSARVPLMPWYIQSGHAI